MKKYISLLIITLLCLGSMSCLAQDKKIQFNNKSFTFNYAKTSPLMSINEYYLPKESRKNWSERLIVSKVNSTDSPEFFASDLVQNLSMAKMIKIEKGSGYIISYMIGRKHPDGRYLLEPGFIKVDKCKNGGVCSIQYKQTIPCRNQNEAQSQIELYYLQNEVKFIETMKKTKIPNVQEINYNN